MVTNHKLFFAQSENLLIVEPCFMPTSQPSQNKALSKNTDSQSALAEANSAECDYLNSAVVQQLPESRVRGPLEDEITLPLNLLQTWLKKHVRSLGGNQIETDSVCNDVCLKLWRWSEVKGIELPLSDWQKLAYCFARNAVSNEIKKISRQKRRETVTDFSEVDLNTFNFQDASHLTPPITANTQTEIRSLGLPVWRAIRSYTLTERWAFLLRDDFSYARQMLESKAITGAQLAEVLELPLTELLSILEREEPLKQTEMAQVWTRNFPNHPIGRTAFSMAFHRIIPKLKKLIF